MLNKTHGLEGSFFNSYEFDPRHELWILVGKRVVKTPTNPMAVTSWGSAEIQEAQLSVDQRCQTRNKNGSKRKVWAIFKRFFLLGGVEDVWRMPKMMNSATCISFRRVAIWECFARCFFFSEVSCASKKNAQNHMGHWIGFGESSKCALHNGDFCTHWPDGLGTQRLRKIVPVASRWCNWNWASHIHTLSGVVHDRSLCHIPSSI